MRLLHESGAPGIQVCAGLTDLFESVVLDLYHSALSELGPAGGKLEAEIALVPHGGFGRRDMAPYSDIDLMLLHSPAARDRIAPLAKQLSLSVTDAELDLGFSPRTPEQAVSFALDDAKTLTSLAESRYLGGSVRLFRRYMQKLKRATMSRHRRLIPLIDDVRRAERRTFGESVYMLEPNVKRSRGGLRDLQMARWLGFIRYGEPDPGQLRGMGYLSREDRNILRNAREYLLKMRNELQFHAGKAVDVLDRHEQMRLAEKYGYTGCDGMLPVEEFMRDYFDHTSQVRYTVTNLIETTKYRSSWLSFFTPLVTRKIDEDFRVGPAHIGATPEGLEKVTRSLPEVLRLMELANTWNKRIDHPTWIAVRAAMMESPPADDLTDETIERFMSLLKEPNRLGHLLRRLHQLRVLEKIIPAMSHARCLLQFNEYHKYTVDEHTLLAVQHATDFRNDKGTLGEAYRAIKRKHILHLSLLLHDLGKGFPEDHSEVGRRIAIEVADRLKLSERDREVLVFNVHQHLRMSLIIQRLDINDEKTIVEFARQVGTPGALRQLYCLTCADMAAVGPDVLNEWKLGLLTELYHRTHFHITGTTTGSLTSERMARTRQQLTKLHPTDEWWRREVLALPAGYLFDIPSNILAERLSSLRDLTRNDAAAWGRFVSERHAMEYMVGAYEEINPGIFHRITGALSSKGMQIVSAEIHTLSGELAFDRFFVLDLDYTDEPPPERVEEVCATIVKALKERGDEEPVFRKTWKGSSKRPKAMESLETRVLFDNTTSETQTLVNVFAYDRLGLLYQMSRALFECGLSVHIAKIGTYYDQIADVFYVTDAVGNKVEGEQQLEAIRKHVLEAIERGTTDD